MGQLPVFATLPVPNLVLGKGHRVAYRIKGLNLGYPEVKSGSKLLASFG